MRGHAAAWTSVGAANAALNHRRVGSEKTASGSTRTILDALRPTSDAPLSTVHADAAGMAPFVCAADNCWERMDLTFGGPTARSWASNQHLAALGGRTVEQALAEGEETRDVWRAVHTKVPSDFDLTGVSATVEHLLRTSRSAISHRAAPTGLSTGSHRTGSQCR